jgi:tRNA(Arg) A34 adenosine deaminase TadA
MREAIRVATEKGSDPSLAPIGSVIVMNGNILVRAVTKCLSIMMPSRTRRSKLFARQVHQLTRGN